jgi:hypothetical protein
MTESLLTATVELMDGMASRSIRVPAILWPWMLRPTSAELTVGRGPWRCFW